jgi:uncharacterized membrane protein
MGTEMPVELLVANLGPQVSSDAAVQRLIELNRSGIVELISMVVLAKGEKGKVTFRNTPDLRQEEGPILGTLAGITLGLFAGITGLLGEGDAGVASKYVAGHIVGVGMSAAHLKQLAQELSPGTSAILALIGHEFVELTIRELRSLVSGVRCFTLEAEVPGQTGDQEGG